MAARLSRKRLQGGEADADSWVDPSRPPGPETFNGKQIDPAPGFWDKYLS